MNVVRAAASLCAVLLVGCSHLLGSDRTDQEKIRVDELLSVVKQAIKDAQNDLGGDSSLPPLAALTLTLQTKATIGASATAELLIVSGSVKGEDASTQTISLKLVPPPPPTFKALVKQDERYVQVVAAIKAASAAASQARPVDSTDLQVDTVGATVAFDVSRTVSGGIKLDVAGLKIGPGASYSTAGSQKIDLTFQRQKPRP